MDLPKYRISAYKLFMKKHLLTGAAQGLLEKDNIERARAEWNSLSSEEKEVWRIQTDGVFETNKQSWIVHPDSF